MVVFTHTELADVPLIVSILTSTGERARLATGSAPTPTSFSLGAGLSWIASHHRDSFQSSSPEHLWHALRELFLESADLSSLIWYLIVVISIIKHQ